MNRTPPPASLLSVSISWVGPPHTHTNIPVYLSHLSSSSVENATAMQEELKQQPAMIERLYGDINTLIHTQRPELSLSLSLCTAALVTDLLIDRASFKVSGPPDVRCGVVTFGNHRERMPRVKSHSLWNYWTTVTLTPLFLSFTHDSLCICRFRWVLYEPLKAYRKLCM